MSFHPQSLDFSKSMTADIGDKLPQLKMVRRGQRRKEAEKKKSFEWKPIYFVIKNEEPFLIISELQLFWLIYMQIKQYQELSFTVFSIAHMPKLFT